MKTDVFQFPKNMIMIISTFIHGSGFIIVKSFYRSVFFPLIFYVIALKYILRIFPLIRKRLTVKRAIISVLLIVASSVVHGQDVFVFSGSVTDSKNEPVPYCTIYLRNLNTGTTTDINGIFSIKLPNGLCDTAQISMLGYKRQNLFISSETRNLPKNIKLADSLYSLKEIVITPKKFNTYNQIKKRPTNIHSVTIGTIYTSEIAQLFINPFSTLTRLKGIDFYKSPYEKNRTTFRIKVYEADKDNAPSVMLNTKDILVTTENKGYVFFDLTSYNILIPEGGYFIAIEWLRTDANKIETKSTLKWTDIKTGNVIEFESNIYYPALGQKEMKGLIPVIYHKNFKGVWHYVNALAKMYTFFPALEY